MTQSVLEVEDLHLSFPGYKADVRAPNHISLHISRGEIAGMVGESGSGKSMTVMLAMRLLPEGSYRIHQGRASLLGEDVLNASEKQMRQWRDARVAMVFQEPTTALDPTRRIDQQTMGVIHHHQALSRTGVRQKAVALLGEMQIPDTPGIMKRLPFKLSGGMRQRVMVALAFPYEPRSVAADEPTTALDVTVQLQVLRLLKLEARASGTAVLSISHDIAVVSQLCDRLYVIYARSAIESDPTQIIIQRPMCPHSVGLPRCTPEHGEPRVLLSAIPSTVLNLTCLPVGYVFREHCFTAGPRCEEMPTLDSQGGADQQPVCWCPQLETTHA